MAYVYKMSNYLSIKQFAALVDIPINTLRNWDEAGKLIPVERTPGGKRYYVLEQAGYALVLKQARKNRKDGKKDEIDNEENNGTDSISSSNI